MIGALKTTRKEIKIAAIANKILLIFLLWVYRGRVNIKGSWKNSCLVVNQNIDADHLILQFQNEAEA